MSFLLFYCEFFGYIHGKTHKIEKSNLLVYFSLFPNAQIFFFAVRKYFKMVHSGLKMGPRTLLKFLVSLVGPLAHFYSLMNHFEIFLTARKNCLIAKREK